MSKNSDYEHDNDNENEAPSDIVKAHTTRALETTSPAALASLQSLGAAADAYVATHPRGGRDPLLKMRKDATWEYGIEATPVENGSIWAINPLSLERGFVAWSRDKKAKQKKLGEIMDSITSSMPDKLTLRDVGAEWVEQVSMQMKCVSGEDIGQQVIFKTSSDGGREAFADIVAAIGDKVRAKSVELVPHVKLDHTSYNHPDFGQIHKPKFGIVGWTKLDDDGRRSPQPTPPQPTPPQPANDSGNAGEPVRRRRRA